MTVAALPVLPAARARRAWMPWLPAALILAIAVWRQATTSLDCDVSWLLTVCDHLLDGQRLYVDIIETNPPASVWLYLPGSALARVIGAAPEAVTAGWVFALGIASILGAAQLLDRAVRPSVATAAAFCFLLLPGYCFAQREHVALLLLLPLMALSAARIEGREPGLPASAVAGIGAGLVMAIKPHFVLAVVPLLLFVAWRRRSLRALFGVEAGCALAVVIAYAAAVLLAYPRFLTEMVPVLRVAYLPARVSFGTLLIHPCFLVTVGAWALTLAVAPRRATTTPLALPVLASAGFTAAALAQGKGYANHFTPGLALALFALALALGGMGAKPGSRIAALLGAGLTGLSLMAFWPVPDVARLAALIEAGAPPHPRMMMVGGNLAVGHPVTRRVGGVWVQRQHNLWISAGAPDILRAGSLDARARAALLAAVAVDERMLIEDVARGRPDVVLVQGPAWLGWIAHHPAVAVALRDYRPSGTADGVILLTRQSRSALRQANESAPKFPSGRRRFERE